MTDQKHTNELVSPATPSDAELNDIALTLLGPSATYDREKLRDVISSYRRRERRGTSTDEEREAQGWREAEAYADDHEPSKRSETADDFMTGWRTADRLRHSEVPEPSAEHFHIWSEMSCPPGHCRMRPQGEPSDAAVLAAREVWRAYWDRDEGGTDEEAMHAALRAGAEAGGEPRAKRSGPCGFSLDQCRCELPAEHDGMHECSAHRFSDRPLWTGGER